jgi:hypothetical protein
MEERERELAAAPPVPPAAEDVSREEPERIEPTEAAPKADRELPAAEDDPHK